MKKTMTKLTIHLMLLAGALFVLATSASALTVDEIIKKANLASYYAGDDGRAQVKMTITDASGNTRVREFTILRKDGKDGKDGGDQKFYTYFKAPADVRQMAFLVWKHVDGDDDRWLWLPALNLKKRIAPGDKRTSFVGSDFLYEDVSGRNLNDDNHKLLEETTEHYVLENTPKDADSVEFASYKVWIDKTTFIPVKAEYTDKKGKLYRTVEALKVETIQGFPTVVSAKASDLIAGSSTINEFSKVEYNIGLKDRIFTERFLRRPPREVK